MKKVEKKILSKWFDLVCSGDKTFEFRKDEDNIQEGDILILCEVDETRRYTGRFMPCLVGTVLRHSDWQDIPDGFCVISIKELITRDKAKAAGWL